MSDMQQPSPSPSDESFEMADGMSLLAHLSSNLVHLDDQEQGGAAAHTPVRAARAAAHRGSRLVVLNSGGSAASTPSPLARMNLSEDVKRGAMATMALSPTSSPARKRKLEANDGGPGGPPAASPRARLKLGRRAGVSLTFEDGNGVLEVARQGGEAGGGGGQGQGGVGAGEQAQGSLPSKAAGGGGGAKKGHKTAKVGCTCSKSRCLKCYCVCFSKQGYCGPECACVSCLNTPAPEHKRIRESTMQTILLKNPNAFFRKAKSAGQGCKCRKSKCLQKYCECYLAGRACRDICSCIGCQNCNGVKRRKLGPSHPQPQQHAAAAYPPQAPAGAPAGAPGSPGSLRASASSELLGRRIAGSLSPSASILAGAARPGMPGGRESNKSVGGRGGGASKAASKAAALAAQMAAKAVTGAQLELGSPAFRREGAPSGGVANLTPISMITHATFLQSPFAGEGEGQSKVEAAGGGGQEAVNGRAGMSTSEWQQKQLRQALKAGQVADAGSGKQTEASSVKSR